MHLELRDDCRSSRDVMARARAVAAFRKKAFAPLPPPPKSKGVKVYSTPIGPPFVRMIEEIPNFLSLARREAEEMKITTVSVTRILRTCAIYFGIPVIEIISARRTAGLVYPRQIAMFLARKLTTKSFPEIGRRIGGRDHTTILHGANKIAALLPNDARVAADAAKIEAMLAP